MQPGGDEEPPMQAPYAWLFHVMQAPLGPPQGVIAALFETAPETLL